MSKDNLIVFMLQRKYNNLPIYLWEVVTVSRFPKSFHFSPDIYFSNFVIFCCVTHNLFLSNREADS